MDSRNQQGGERLRIVDAVSALEGAGAREKEPLDVSDNRVSAPVQETRVHETDCSAES